MVFVICAFYLYYDVFRERTVPKAMIFSTMAIATAAAYLGEPRTAFLTGLLPAIGLTAMGMAVYWLKQQNKIGTADFMLLACISLLIPMQMQPPFVLLSEPAYPFVFSVILNSILAFGIWLMWNFSDHIRMLGSSEKGQAIPFVAFIVAGIVISFLMGNLLVFIL